MADTSVKRWKFLRPQDLVWLLLMAALGFTSPGGSEAEWEVLLAIAVFLVVEPRVVFFQKGSGAVGAIAIKLFLCYLLIGVTGGIASTHYLILMIPVVSAATTLGAAGTIATTLAASAIYLSFLLFVDWQSFLTGELYLRVLLLGVLAMLTNQLTAATREQSRQYIEAAEQLAAANENLQRAEAAVRRSERLAALGQLTAGLAHELRNPLGTMKASAEVLLQNIGPDQTVARELAGYIATEVDRTNSLITRFLDFARPMPLKKAPAELTEVLEVAIRMLERREPKLPVLVHRNYSPDIPPLPLDSELMERVFYNLLLNAAEASPPGGTITVKTRAIPGAVEIAVIDRGSGIDQAHMESIFNPFFTTKPAGVGLGLAIVSKIIGEHGGTMAVESEPGQGSVFRVLLPAPVRS